LCNRRATEGILSYALLTNGRAKLCRRFRNRNNKVLKTYFRFTEFVFFFFVTKPLPPSSLSCAQFICLELFRNRSWTAAAKLDARDDGRNNNNNGPITRSCGSPIMDLAHHCAADYGSGNGNRHYYYEYGVQTTARRSDAGNGRRLESHHGAYWQWQHSDGSAPERFQHHQHQYRYGQNIFANHAAGRWDDTADCSPSPEQLRADDGLPKNARTGWDDSYFRYRV